jgi:glycosyltransferase involved in cell wall biosynthesis
MTLRVLVVAPQPFYQERGTPIATRCLIEALRAADHEVDVLTYHLGEDPKIPGVRVFRTAALPFVRDMPIGFSLRKVLCDVLIGWRLLTLARRNRYDVLHAVEEAVFLGLLVRVVTRTRLVYDMDSSLPEQLVGRYRGLRAVSGLLSGLERLAIARSDLVLAVCEDLAKHARGYETETPVDVVEDVSLLTDGPEGGEVENLRRSLPDRGLLALYVGNLERYQGVRQILEAIAGLRNPGVAFKFVAIGGTEHDVASYRARAASLGIADRVTFLGARPLADLGAYLSQADILVSPRLGGQNTPMKLYSYLASGKAVLATRIPAHTQVLTDDCALLVEPEAAALARGLRALLKDPVLRLNLGAAARRLAATRYSLEQFRDSVASAYRRLEPAQQSPVHEQQLT